MRLLAAPAQTEESLSQGALPKQVRPSKEGAHMFSTQMPGWNWHLTSPRRHCKSRRHFHM